MAIELEEGGDKENGVADERPSCGQGKEGVSKGRVGKERGE